MKGNELFLKALFVSLSIHTVFMLWVFLANLNNPLKKKQMQKRVEISYRPLPKKSVDVQQRPIKPVQQLDLSNDFTASKPNTMPVKLVKEAYSTQGTFPMYERKPEPLRNMQVSRRVSIVPISSEKINNPAYTSYNEIVRSRIEDKVYANYDRMEEGRVYLTFVIDANGVLKAAQIIPEKTTAGVHLQEISLKSLKDASPFPIFLKGMTLPEYTFNIEIQYHVSE